MLWDCFYLKIYIVSFCPVVETVHSVAAKFSGGWQLPWAFVFFQNLMYRFFLAKSRNST